MPEFLITSPDGKKYRVTGPEGSTKEQALERVRSQNQTPETPEAAPERNAIDNTVGGFSRGLMGSLGFPVDAINSALGGLGLPISDAPLGGSESLSGMLESVGGTTDYDPDSFAGNAAEVVGGTVPFALTGTTSNLLKELGISLVPGAARGAVAAAGGGDTEKLAAEVLGGLTANNVVQSTRVASKFARQLYDPFSVRGAERQVAEGLQGVVTDKDAAIRALDSPPPIDAPFMAGARSRDFGLMALERQLVREGRTGEILAREQDLNTAIKKQIMDLAGDGATDDMIAFIRTDSDRVLANLDEAVTRAQKEAETMARTLPPIPGKQEAAASRLVAEKMDEVLTAARSDERLLWNEALSGERDSARAVDDILARIDSVEGSLLAGDPDIPASVKSAAEKLKANPNLDNIQSFRSRLLQEKRANNGSGAADPNLNRILTTIDEVVLDSLSDAASDPARMKNAREFSKGLNDRFTRGPLAKVIGVDARGGAKVDPSLTLQALLAKGPKGLVQVRALLDSTKDPSGVVGGYSSLDLRKAVDDYMRGQFARVAFDKKGEIDPVSVDRFIANNAEILDEPEFADLKSFLKNTKSKAVILDGLKAEKTATETALNKSKAALFLGKEDPRRLMERIMDSNTPNQDFDDIYSRVSADASATKGFKRLYAESLMSSIERSVSDVSGERVLSESMLQGVLDKQTRNIEKLYGKGGRKQVESALEGLRMFMSPEKARATKVGSDTIENLTKSPLLELAGRVFGTQVSGALPSAGAGSIQRAAILSRIGKRLFGNIGAEKRRELLVQAFEDPKKMKYLLEMEMSPRTEGEIAETLNAWLGSAASETDDMTEEDNGN